MLSSCNKDTGSETYVSPVNLAVTAFSLSADLDNPGLDSVYFSIDLEHGIIFNADSLRKGTRIDKVVPQITFGFTPSEAVIAMSGGTTREGEVDFRTNPTDSIDFTGNVELRVKALDGTIGTTYKIKVNVHKMETDSLYWEEMDYRSMPTRLPDPKAMKTLEFDNSAISLVEESDGTYTVVKALSLESMEWDKKQIMLPFTPVIQTLCGGDGEAWMLASDGMLWKGDTSLGSWEQTGQIWSALIGTYGTTAVGLRKAGSTTVFAQYPLNELNEKEIPSGFPVSGFSNFVTLENKWTSSPVAFFTGGVGADGTCTDSTWAFDGAEWIRLSSGGIPALEGASVIPYYNYRPSADGLSQIEYEVWMLLGGRKADGSFNRSVYISYDNGVNWTIGTSSLQLPEEIPAMAYCDNIVVDFARSSDLNAGWQSALSHPRRVNSWVDGSTIHWECPYVYLFGGYSPEGRLYTTVWRGVLGRLTFTPII